MYAESTPDYAMEYAWYVTVVNGLETFTAGVWIWKWPLVTPRSMTIGEVAQYGQRGVFRLTGEGYSIVADAVVAVYVTGSKLVVKVTDPDTYALLFSEEPATVDFVARTPDSGQTVTTEQIVYQE